MHCLLTSSFAYNHFIYQLIMMVIYIIWTKVIVKLQLIYSHVDFKDPVVCGKLFLRL